MAKEKDPAALFEFRTGNQIGFNRLFEFGAEKFFLDDVSDVMKELKTLIGGSVRFETKDTARDWEQLLTSEFGRNK